MKYTKRAQSPDDLVQGLIDRGMAVEDRTRAITELARFGYHHLGGYRYVFRRMLPEEQQRPDLKQFRDELYIPGSSFDAVIRLAEFDAGLREVCLAGVLDLERRIRTAVADVVGRRNPFAHLHPKFLNSRVCSTPVRRGPRSESSRDQPTQTKFEAWKSRYTHAVKDARSEDFVIHHQKKYGEDLPIWSTMEVLQMGSLPYFIELIRKDDQNEISNMFGITRGTVLTTWLRSMADLRNICAHSSRLFNRSAKRPIVVRQHDYYGRLLGHLESLPDEQDDEITPRISTYRQLALLNFMLTSHPGHSDFSTRLTTQLETMDSIRLMDSETPFLSPERDIGFPIDWRTLDLWTKQ
jgi:abortive infection bacteriophage resistance protein